MIPDKMQCPNCWHWILRRICVPQWVCNNCHFTFTDDEIADEFLEDWDRRCYDE